MLHQRKVRLLIFKCSYTSDNSIKICLCSSLDWLCFGSTGTSCHFFFLLLSAPCFLDLMFSSTLMGGKCFETLHAWKFLYCTIFLFDRLAGNRMLDFSHRIFKAFPHCPLVYRVAVRVWCPSDCQSLYDTWFFFSGSI